MELWNNKKEFDHLYSRNSKGDVKEWRVSVKDETFQSVIHVQYGLATGKLTERFTEVNKGKNLGKANATTHFEQACSMAESKWNKQKKKGYKSLEDLGVNPSPHLNKYEYLRKNLPQENTDDNDVIKPMLAQKFYKELKSGIIVNVKKWPVLGQPKINGVRCVAHVEGGVCILLSREGISWNLPEIQNDVEDFCNECGIEDIIIDGELYIHNYKLNEIVSAVKKYNLNTVMVKFYMFDIADERPQLERIKHLHSMWKTASRFKEKLKFVPSKGIGNEKAAIEFKDKCIADGYEGAIFRDIQADYKFGKRPTTMVKLKNTESSEFKIIDIIDSETNKGKAIFVCKNNLNHEEFKVNPTYSDIEKEEMYTNKHKYIGKQVTLTYYERTAAPKELPFHITETTIRDYEKSEIIKTNIKSEFFKEIKVF